MAASEEEANRAREHFSEELAGRGAHAIGVEPGERHGKHGFVVVAYVPPDTSAALPDRLHLPKEKGGVSVPLVVRRQSPFRPEKP